jgi:hypothetical protein
MNLATSRYQAADLIETSGRAAAGITLGYPRWKLRYPLVANLRQLAPTKEIIAVEDPAMFDEMYRNRLRDLGVEGVRELLEGVANQANNERLVLCCYEDLTKPGLWCHRRIFSSWWEENTGEVVPELEPDVLQEKLFE